MFVPFFKSIQELPFLYLTAGYAAVVSTLVLVWDIIKWRKGRLKLTLEVKFNLVRQEYGYDPALDKNTEFRMLPTLVIKAINTGGKTTTISEMKVLTHESDISKLPENALEVMYQLLNPRIIKPGEETTAIYNHPERIMLCRQVGFWLYLIHSYSGDDPVKLEIRPKQGVNSQTLHFTVT